VSVAFDQTPRATPAQTHWRGRTLFPTDFSSADIRGLSRQLRLRSVFSARMTNAEAVQELADVVDDLLAGKNNIATARLRMMRKLKSLGYDPERGFPQDMAAIPPAERGSLRDLSSEGRIDLMLSTNVRVAANFGRVLAGNSEYARREYPAWELVRLYHREIPRGSAESHSAGWQERWHDAGEFCDWEGAAKAPMIALKDSPIWEALGDGAGGFDDTLGNPFPPFAFNSGMATRAVPRAECIDLGLIEENEIPAPMRAQLTPGEQEVNDVFARLSPDLQAVLRKELAA